VILILSSLETIRRDIRVYLFLLGSNVKKCKTQKVKKLDT